MLLGVTAQHQEERPYGKEVLAGEAFQLADPLELFSGPRTVDGFRPQASRCQTAFAERCCECLLLAETVEKLVVERVCNVCCWWQQACPLRLCSVLRRFGQLVCGVLDLGHRSGGCRRRRRDGGVADQAFEVLDDGGEQELVTRALEAAQS